MRTATPRPPELLESRARTFLSALPPELRLDATREHFPHVLNLLAADWEMPSRFVARLDTLLMDQRGQREGFPFETISELAALREYYLDAVHPEMRPRLTARDRDAWR